MLLGTFAVNNHQIHINYNHYHVNDDNSSSNNNRNGNTHHHHNYHGTALYSIISKMNHDCRCNTINQHHNNNVSMSTYAIRDIMKDEELTTSYLHNYHYDNSSSNVDDNENFNIDNTDNNYNSHDDNNNNNNNNNPQLHQRQHHHQYYGNCNVDNKIVVSNYNSRSNMSRRQRHDCLVQYLFTCKCSTCEYDLMIIKNMRKMQRCLDNHDSNDDDDEADEY